MGLFSQLFKRKKEKIKKFSTTTTNATEGSDAKKDLNPNIKLLLEKVTKKQRITNSELNQLIEFYFNKKPIQHTLYTFNKPFSDAMCFEIVSVNTILNENNDLGYILIQMKDVSFGDNSPVALSLQVSIEDFHDFFKPLQLKGNPNANAH